MEQQPIRSLTPYQSANKLQIRVCRMWTTKSIGDNPLPISLDCVFVDKDVRLLHLFTYRSMLAFFRI